MMNIEEKFKEKSLKVFTDWGFTEKEIGHIILNNLELAKNLSNFENDSLENIIKKYFNMDFTIKEGD